MSNEIPFYTQTAILDRYIHRARVDISPDIIETIVNLLQGNSELRAYFFRNKPHSDWAAILWEKGFFDAPPAPIPTADGAILPRWDVQDFLISVANQAPDIVVKHVESIDGQGWYISQAVRALKEIPLSAAEHAISRLLELLHRPNVDRMVCEYIYDLMISFAKNKQEESAFVLFDLLTEPVSIDKNETANLYSKKSPGSKSDVVFANWKEPNIINLFSDIDPFRLIEILENHLRRALILEETDPKNPYYKKGSSWRAAIEDSDQNHYLDYKETLLDKLRNAINFQLQKNDPKVNLLIQDYLVDDYNIFHRIGIHFVREHPTIFAQELQQLMCSLENLDDYFIHHEFFLLLRDGFRYLSSDGKEYLILKMLEGPPVSSQNKYSAWWQASPAQAMMSEDEYVKNQIKHWKFSRLWMIREHLTDKSKAVFTELFMELGEPSMPPEFTSYMSGFQQIKDVSPLSATEIASLSPPDLLAFLAAWKPDTKHKLWPYEQTYSSLGREVAKVIFENLNKFKDVFFNIANMNSGYGYAIVDEFSKLDQRTEELWQLIIGLCGKLLELDEIRLADNPGSDDSWYYFKSSLANLIRDSFSNPQKRAPDELFQEVKGILLILVNDPDPNAERDKPPKENSGFWDPSQIALNSIRPIALNTLITYAMEEYKLQYENYTHELGPKRLSADIQQVLDAKLDISNEPSWAIRSVFGERLVNLFWLDKEWTEKNLERIFPSYDDDESKWLFTSAMSSYVIFRNFFVEIYGVLKPKYEQAIVLFSNGYLWKTHLQPVTHLAGHLVWGYLESDYEIDLSNIDYGNLFVKFFLAFDAEGRKDGAFICRRVMDVPENVEKYWNKIRKIWEWRAQEAVRAGHTNDFDEEMLQFAQLTSVAPETETIQSLWPMLTAIIFAVCNLEIGVGMRLKTSLPRKLKLSQYRLLSYIQ